MCRSTRASQGGKRSSIWTKQKAVKHVEVVCALYEYQLRQGRHFLHEHPWTAKSWDLPCIKKVMEHPSVEVVQGHMCQFGMTSRVGHQDGPTGPVKKPTGFMTSSWWIRQELGKKCDGSHDHVPLMEGRAAGAAIYPQGLCEAICRGISKQKKEDQKTTVNSGKLSSLGL